MIVSGERCENRCGRIFALDAVVTERGGASGCPVLPKDNLTPRYGCRIRHGSEQAGKHLTCGGQNC